MNIQEWIEAGKPWNVILHGDCMELMEHIEDKSIELACVDPPYGININNNMGRRRGQKHSGSGSLACACHLEKFDFLAIEKDEDYHSASVKRLEELRSQGRLFI